MAGARNGPKANFATYLTPNAEIFSYTCADSLALSKGTLVEIRDPATASMANAFTLNDPATASSGAFCGIVFRDKEANDGATQVAVLKSGRADMRASGAILFGQPVYCAGNDEVKAANAFGGVTVSSGFLASYIVGIAEETATDGETIVVRFRS